MWGKDWAESWEGKEGVPSRNRLRAVSEVIKGGGSSSPKGLVIGEESSLCIRHSLSNHSPGQPLSTQGTRTHR